MKRQSQANDVSKEEEEEKKKKKVQKNTHNTHTEQGAVANPCITG